MLDVQFKTYILVGMLKISVTGWSLRPRARRNRRNPGQTRERLLQAAFTEMFRSGYRGTEIDAILATAGVTKGAMYHHFENKQALGHAVVDEVILEITNAKWVRPLARAADPIAALCKVIRGSSLRPSDIARGCPLNNLAQEMSPLDEQFRRRIVKIFAIWQNAVATALRDAQEKGMLRPGIRIDETAQFVMAAYEGYVSLSKNAQDPQILKAGSQTLARYIEALRVRRGRRLVRGIR